jgi:hypothetical protein
MFPRLPHQQEENEMVFETIPPMHSFTLLFHRLHMAFNFMTHQELVFMSSCIHLDETGSFSLLLNFLPRHQIS